MIKYQWFTFYTNVWWVEPPKTPQWFL